MTSAPARPPTSHDADGLSEQDFRRLAAFIHDRAGIRMPPAKRIFLEGRLRKRLNARGISSYAAYCDWLFEQGGMAQEEVALIDCVTTNKTDFFREPHHFEYLERHILPDLLSRGVGVAQPLRVWSAACSSGAEPYTLAMVCQDFAERTPRLRYDILASDISTRMLDEAARAIYPHAAIEPVPMELRRKYLLRDDQRQEVRIVQELRQHVTLARINLVASDYGVTELQDVIFCRNLLIYFDRATQKRVLHRLCALLRPGGYLALGHSESINGMDLPLRQVATTMFRREGRR